MIINIFLTTTKSKEKASGINAKGYLFRKDFLKLVTLIIFSDFRTKLIFLFEKRRYHLFFNKIDYLETGFLVF